MTDTPIRPQSHIIGDIGQTAVALVLKEWGWTADPVASDYGEDLDCNVFIDSRRTALHFRCQVKSSGNAGDRVRQLESGDFSISINTSTCKIWLLSYFPVLLIVYDNATRQIFWADATRQVRENIDKLSQSTLTLHITRQHLLPHSKTEIIQLVQSFYAHLLRLSSTLLTCEIYPVFMPGYRALPYRAILDSNFRKHLPARIKLGH